jgi:anti-sigma factor RsiW
MPEHESEDLSLFELLSAYLDGEVTPEERHLVQQQLDHNPEAKKLYNQLLRLQQDVNHIPTPSLDVSLLEKQVFQKLDRKRNKRLVIVGSSLLALLTWGLGWLFWSDPRSIQTAYESASSSEPLILALNHPLVDLPVTGEESLEK